jgi:hypothetical protein
LPHKSRLLGNGLNKNKIFSEQNYQSFNPCQLSQFDQSGVYAMRFFTVSFLSLSLVAATGALAAPTETAQVSDFSGKILINHGKGFNKAATNVGLKPGDSVFIGDNSAITISYQAAQCKVTYNTPQTLFVPAKAPCKAGQTVGQIAGTTVEPANFNHLAPYTSGLGAPPSIGIGFFSITFLTAVSNQILQGASGAP